MRVYHSNRLEILADELARLMVSGPVEPLAPERIVVPHQTMGNWLRLELARRLGVAAHIRFEQPAGFAWSMLRGVLPALPKTHAYSPETLRWHLFEALPDFAAAPGAEDVRGFLADQDDRKRFELADKLARVFDRCINFRPDWIRDWERGETPHWQARLWRSLTEKIAAPHWVAALDQFQREADAAERPGDWPQRVFFFNVGALAPAYLDWLARLGQDIDLHLLLFNPCEAYWGDLHSERESRRRAGAADREALHFTEGNKLLAAWGAAGRDTFDALLDAGESFEYFPRAPADSRLAVLQRDVQLLRSAVEGAGDESPPPDASLQIHCCHSAMREAEALHDRLLDLLQIHVDIEPADILILTPDPARYGPLIAAVFAAGGIIPVVLSRVRQADSATAKAFLDLLSLPGTRYRAEDLLAPLDAPAVRARFRIEEHSLPAIRGWVRQAGIRREATADGVKSPAGDEPRRDWSDHSWEAGLRRLLMGYAAGETGELILDIHPCALRGEAGFPVSESDYATLGRFASFCRAAFKLRELLPRSAPADEWSWLLHTLLNDFFDDGSSIAALGGFDAARAVADEVQSLKSLIEAFRGQAGGIDCPIPFAVVRQTLRESAAGPAAGPARLAGGAAIGRLAQGQIFPARIICAVGMNGEGFPRNPPRHTFDVVEWDRRRAGDRDIRREDRFTFLEALLAARSSFIVTYTGRNQRDDSEIPPSVVVEEFTDYLAGRFAAPETGEAGETAAAAPWRGDHPLQAFSPRYFGEGRELFSYSKTMLDAAKLLRGGVRRAPQRFAGKLPEPDEDRRTVDLAELERFFADPAAGLLRERFGIDGFGKEDQALDEMEPLQLNGLERYQLRERLLALLDLDAGEAAETERPEIEKPEMEDPATVNLRRLLLASGILPQGSFGAVELDAERANVEYLRGELANFVKPPAPVKIDLRIAGFRLTGSIPYVVEEADVFFPLDRARRQLIPWWRNGRFKARDLLTIRLRQLAWLAAGYTPIEAVGVWVDGRLSILAPDPKRESIENWLQAWWRGLSAPLPFFPETSWAYAQEMAKDDGSADKALRAAESQWNGNSFQSLPGECESAANQLVWDAAKKPLGREFGDLAEQLLSALEINL